MTSTSAQEVDQVIARAKHAKPGPESKAVETTKAAEKGKTAKSKNSKPKGQNPTLWMESHGGLSVVLLAIACSAALLILFFFIVFTDFSASADFVYTQF